ncbi:cytochrome c oxidase subunit IVB [Lentibacillus cibarius]|uniref:Cytochrome c oxidase subunit IVB n=1 Tax=Lentibacillus cibarius TaxID=2583219 RepID=A0A549YK78_9BACI|nr:cytochrome c oxidase subunit IVB [Lentibacillus cibarius]TMN23464.1 cytochrome c oxidase subunit IVB [Lentibacillus cibarius]TRM12281.1 cytochrome c oxidase subunit IVB [Lentibacillus cibarius]
MAENTNSGEGNPFHRQKNREEMKKQLISFALMILFTIIAFVIVTTDMMKEMYVIPVLLILAIVQVAFQLYYFMHLKDKGHEFASVMIYGGVWAAALTLAGLGVITWW